MPIFVWKEQDKEYRMPIFVWKEQDKEYRLPFEGTPTVASLLQKHGITFPSPCGGNGRCGKCIVMLWGQVSSPDEREEQAGCRLACRARLLGDARGELFHTDVPFASIDSSGYTPTEELRALSAAVDIGTTTLAVKVFDADGASVGNASCLNPQRTYGGDVISRIDAALHGKQEELQVCVAESLLSLLHQAGGDRAENLVFTGNTSMLYLLTGRPPHSIAVSPFRADTLFGQEILWQDRPVYLPPCINAFVGADTTCAVLASGMTERAETALLCDIGTNGELALWKDSRLYVTSTAAGPAFEGAEITCGCGYIPGAVDKVWAVGGRIYTHTVENKPAVGLCGSGLLDAAAAMLETGFMDETGAMDGDLVLTANGGSITLTQKDIRKLQLAKGAIAAGIQVLLRQAGVAEAEVQTVYLAGGFGTHLSPAGAAKIGLIPYSFAGKTVPLGNAALTGACMILCQKGAKEKALEIAKASIHIELGGSEDFNNAFVEHMLFR